MEVTLLEAPVWIAVNGARRVVLTCSPAAPDALAIGHLLTEGWIRSVTDVRSIRVATGPGGSSGVDVDLDAALVADAEALRSHQLQHGCGLRHFVDCEPLTTRETAGAVTDLAFDVVFRALFAAADAASPGGGVHAAALSDGVTLQHCAIDVARHCAVDRSVGLACLAGVEPNRYGLVLTSRVSGAIALKAVRSRVLWLASRSVATPLAREIAAAGGVEIHENAARRASRRPQRTRAARDAATGRGGDDGGEAAG